MTTEPSHQPPGMAPGDHAGASPLDLDAVRKIAALARLRPDDAALEGYRDDLASILGHVETLSALDVEGVEPMAHPLDTRNRLDPDEVSRSMPTDDLLRNAPAARGPYVDVPKVLGEGGG